MRDCRLNLDITVIFYSVSPIVLEIRITDVYHKYNRPASPLILILQFLFMYLQIYRIIFLYIYKLLIPAKFIRGLQWKMKISHQLYLCDLIQTKKKILAMCQTKRQRRKTDNFCWLMILSLSNVHYARLKYKLKL